MISAAGPPPKAGANGVQGVGQGASGDGCCDNVGARAQALIDRVPPCTSEYMPEKTAVLTMIKSGHAQGSLQIPFGHIVPTLLK